MKLRYADESFCCIKKYFKRNVDNMLQCLLDMPYLCRVRSFMFLTNSVDSANA